MELAPASGSGWEDVPVAAARIAQPTAGRRGGHGGRDQLVRRGWCGRRLRREQLVREWHVHAWAKVAVQAAGLLEARDARAHLQLVVEEIALRVVAPSRCRRLRCQAGGVAHMDELVGLQPPQRLYLHGMHPRRRLSALRHLRQRPRLVW